MLQTIPGGATAKPFETHHNALDMPMYFRVSPELYLKRLIIGGMNKVFEINRNFRNEGLSTRHNPEFTMIEFYQAYGTYHDLMDFTEKLFRSIALDICSSTNVYYQGNDLDFSKSFKRITMINSILQYNPSLIATDLNQENVKTNCRSIRYSN